LIDTFGYHKHHENLARTGGRANDANYSRIELKDNVEDPEGEKADQASSAVLQASNTVKKKETSYIKRLKPEDIARNKKIMETRSGDLMYISPLVKGYCLKIKLWLQFYIDDLRPMEWNLEAYDHLVYPEEQKDLVLSFVEHHNSSAPTDSSGFDDVIKGKGCGLVLLLSGPPGTGKTLTAEAVADKTHRPLLYMHAEDLGVNPSTLGANLKKMFEMAAEWNAVCLLDECDVFLAARNPVDISRNELVSIFLREIEYFQGILFLTTNLYDTIDTAFRSRMSIHLRFNPLAPEARLVLWQKFLSRLPPMPLYADKKENKTQNKENGADEPAPEVHEMICALDNLSEEDLKELSLWELNGREIKSVIKTVKSWCDVKKFDITLARLEAGIKVTAPNSQKRGTIDTSLYDD
jgi:ATPase family associated with various cellular activities (AAA)